MRRYLAFFSIFIMAAFLLCGCNIVPKSVQYQKDEEKVIGRTDTLNPRMEEIQLALTKLGYDTGAIDGRTVQKTREAIKEFQDSRGIKATGYIDKTTLDQIDESRRITEEDTLADSYVIKIKKPDAPEPDKDKPGTKDIQAALRNAGFDPGSIDGKMGPRTRQAVKEFQKTKSLTPDGVVGAKTWAELKKYLKK